MSWVEPIWVKITISVVGVVVFILFTWASATIYDSFSPKSNDFSSYAQPSSILLKNNTPLTIQGLNSLFIMQIDITNSTGKVDCTVTNSANSPISCTGFRMDLGKIDSGQEGTIQFILNPNGNNFTISATGYLNFVNHPIPLVTRSWYCTHSEDGSYYCGP